MDRAVETRHRITGKLATVVAWRRLPGTTHRAPGGVGPNNGGTRIGKGSQKQSEPFDGTFGTSSGGRFSFFGRR
ncbi:hypothetical protein U1Q18_035423 [Sarracenia purpurea var. burkii]